MSYTWIRWVIYISPITHILHRRRRQVQSQLTLLSTSLLSTLPRDGYARHRVSLPRQKAGIVWSKSCRDTSIIQSISISLAKERERQNCGRVGARKGSRGVARGHGDEQMSRRGGGRTLYAERDAHCGLKPPDSPLHYTFLLVWSDSVGQTGEEQLAVVPSYRPSWVGGW